MSGSVALTRKLNGSSSVATSRSSGVSTGAELVSITSTAKLPETVNSPSLTNTVKCSRGPSASPARHRISPVALSIVAPCRRVTAEREHERVQIDVVRHHRHHQHLVLEHPHVRNDGERRCIVHRGDAGS